MKNLDEYTMQDRKLRSKVESGSGLPKERATTPYPQTTVRGPGSAMSSPMNGQKPYGHNPPWRIFFWIQALRIYLVSYSAKYCNLIGYAAMRVSWTALIYLKL